MNTERILPVGDPLFSYHDDRKQHRKRTKRILKPIEAFTFDQLDLSQDKPQVKDEYSWLTKVVTSMSDEQVAAKMKQYTGSIIDIDDAVVEKLLFEAL